MADRGLAMFGASFADKLASAMAGEQQFQRTARQRQGELEEQRRFQTGLLERQQMQKKMQDLQNLHYAIAEKQGMFDPNLTPEEKNKRALGVETTLYQYDPEGYRLLYRKPKPDVAMDEPPKTRGLMGFFFGKSAPKVKEAVQPGLSKLGQEFEQFGLAGAVGKAGIEPIVAPWKALSALGDQFTGPNYPEPLEEMALEEELTIPKKLPRKKNIYQR